MIKDFINTLDYKLPSFPGLVVIVVVAAVVVVVVIVVVSSENGNFYLIEVFLKDWYKFDYSLSN